MIYDSTTVARACERHGVLGSDPALLFFIILLSTTFGVLLAKIDHITEWTDIRRSRAKKYTEELKSCSSIELPYEAPGVRHVYHLYVIETVDSSKRDDLLNYLQEEGIDAKTHYSIPIHLQAGYPWGKDADIRGTLKNVEKNAASCVSLPIYPELTEEEADYVIEKVRQWDSKNA